jgi:AraC-like DNA-binding protein
MYVRRLTLHQHPHFRPWLWHALPAVLCLLLLTPFYVLRTPDKLEAIAAEQAESGRLFDPVIAVAVLQVLAYWIAALMTLHRFARALRERFSSIERLNFHWLQRLLLVNLGMWCFWMLGIVVQAPWSAWMSLIAVPLGLYLLAIFGLRQPAVFVGAHAFVPLAGVLAPAPRYQRSGLDPAQVPELRSRFEALMQTEKPWLDNDLTLAQLAASMAMSPHHLSQLLNEQLHTTFFDCINRRRVDEVKRCLADPAYASQTILDIALSAGFSSKAAFNSAFKQHAGLTPSEFRRQASG